MSLRARWLASLMAGLVLTQEGLVGYLADRVLSLRAARPVRVGIDGRSGAGKSTLMRRLDHRLRASGRQILTSSIDDFHPPGYKHRAASGGFDSPEEYLREGYDLQLFRQVVLDPLGPGGSRRCRLAAWNSSEDTPYPDTWIAADDDAILVAEAAFAFLPVLRPCWELTIWLDIDHQTLLRRVAERDVWAGTPDEVVSRYRRSWLPRHDLYEQLHQPIRSADIVVDNAEWNRPVVMVSE